ncbi:MAG: hypothetical protein HXS52_11715 [Theionarchaea archaeon]|nr:hypothetical protein [Theionarchaea archaeon]
MKRNCCLIFIIAIVLLSSCIGQEKEWTVDDWKDHLMFVDFSSAQGSVPGFVSTSGNVKNLPIGTHMAFDISSDATGLPDVPMSMVLGLTYLGTELVNGKECILLDVSTKVEMEISGESMTVTGRGKEWLGVDGSPMKVEAEGSGNMSGMVIPMTLTGGLTEETVYEGHDCWVFTVTEEVEMMGASTEMEMIIYIDKVSRAQVRMIMKAEEIEQDSGYIEPVYSTGPSTWELGPRETITTPLGTYECQVIYVLEEGKTVGTIWATKDMRAPVKYVYTNETEEFKFEMILVLIEYSSG